MLKLSLLVVFVLLSAQFGHAIRGCDFSVGVSLEKMKCIRSNGYEFAIPRVRSPLVLTDSRNFDRYIDNYVFQTLMLSQTSKMHLQQV